MDTLPDQVFGFLDWDQFGLGCSLDSFLVYNINMECYSCGSKKIVVRTKTSSISIPLGPTLFYKDKVMDCPECDGSFSVDAKKSDEVIEALLDEGNKMCMNQLLERITKDRSQAYIERAFGLPFGIIKKWKKGKFTDTDLSFVRIISSLPWVVEMADMGYLVPSENIGYGNFKRG